MADQTASEIIDQLMQEQKAGDGKKPAAFEGRGRGPAAAQTTPSQPASAAPQTASEIIDEQQRKNEELAALIEKEQAEAALPWYKQAWHEGAPFLGDVAKGTLKRVPADVLRLGQWTGVVPEDIMDPAKHPTIAGYTTYDPTKSGEQFGYNVVAPLAEQAAVGMATEGLGNVILPEAGALGVIGRTGLQGGAGFLTGVAQTGSTTSGLIDAAFGAAGQGLSEWAHIRAAGRRGQAGEVEKLLNFPSETPSELREAAAQRAVKRGKEIPITRAEEQGGFQTLEKEMGPTMAQIEKITKTHPIYSTRTIPIQDVLQPVDDFIKQVAITDQKLAKRLMERRMEWARKLRAGRTAPTTTVAEVQNFKQAFNDVIAGAAYKKRAANIAELSKRARMGSAAAVEAAIPEEVKLLRRLNRTMEVDLRLKEAIVRAVRPAEGTQFSPNAAALAAAFVKPLMTVVGASEAYQILSHSRSGGLTAGEVAMFGAAIVAGKRDPATMTRFLLLTRRFAPDVARSLGMLLYEDNPRAVQAAGLTPPKPPPITQAGRGGERPAAAPLPTGGGRGSPQLPAGGGGRAAVAPGLKPEIQTMLATASRIHGVPLDMLTDIAKKESGGLKNPALAKSPKGAIGVMQIMPATGADYGLSVEDLQDPKKNINMAARYLRWILDQVHWDRDKALAAYNAGIGTVQHYGGVPPYPETQRYVR